MGATVSIAFMTWFASSLVEYRMGRKNPAIHKMLINPFLGFALSLILGFGLGATAGAGVGIGVGVGNALGIATNEFTYNFFSTCSRILDGIKFVSGAAKTKVSSVSAFYHKNRKACDEAVQGVKAGFALVGACILAVLYVFGLIPRSIAYFKRGIDRIKTWRGADAVA